MALNNNDNVKNKWEKPTVGEVLSLMKESAERYQLESWKDSHSIIGVAERTFRRWKNNADFEPNNQSAIPFWGYALLYSAAKGTSYLTPIEGVKWQGVVSPYLYKSEDYQCPPKEVLTQFIGLKSLTGQTREKVGQAIGISPKKLAEQINSESISFATWSLLLLYIGVPVDKVLIK